MKLLVFTDTHNSEKAVNKIIEKAKKHKPDLMLCCGDFTVFMQNAEQFLKILETIKIKTYLVHGNHEDETIIEELCKKFNHVHFLHRRYIRYENLIIMGYGGGGFSLKDPLFSKAEKDFKKIIESCKNCKKILLLHQPPFDSGIDIIYGEKSGNKDAKKFIEKHNIDFVFAGHIHENSETEFIIKSTRYINPGPYGKIIIV